MYAIAKSTITLALFLSLILSAPSASAQTTDISILTQIVQSLQALVKNLTKTASVTSNKAQVVGTGLPSTTGGTFKTLGTKTLAQFLVDVRTALPEGLAAASARMGGEPQDIIAFSSAVIWRNKYTIPIGGGHAATYDDGFYSQDLITGVWDTPLPPSTLGSTVALVDSFGEYGIYGRPASQHSHQHVQTIGDDIILGDTESAGFGASGSKQAHRWIGSLNAGKGGWERYGTYTGTRHQQPHSIHYDAKRNQFVRFTLVGNYPEVDVIPADNKNADWTTFYIPTAKQTPTDIYANGIGYNPKLDAYVLVDQNRAPGRVWVMDAANIAGGWDEVVVLNKTLPPIMANGGMEYIPPMNSFVTANGDEPDRLYYLTPTGTGRLDPWSWSVETFTGSFPATSWYGDGPHQRIRYSSLLNALVVIKKANALTEIWTPSALSTSNPNPTPTPPTVSLTASPTSITAGSASTLTWSSTNSTSCTASNGWTGTKAISGTQSLTPTINTTYTLTCTGSGGTASQSVSVTIGATNPVPPPTTGSSYSTTFSATENPISEGNKWINGKAIGLDWNNVQTAPGKAYAAQFVGLNGASRYSDPIAHLNTTFTADQYAQGTVSRVSGYRNTIDKHEIELLLRFKISANSARGYEILWGQDGEIVVVKWNGPLGSYTSLGGLPNSPTNIAVDGDILRAEIAGSMIKVYRNGTLILTTSDSTWTDGQPGMGFWPTVGSTLASYGWKSYSAGSLGATTPVPPPTVSLTASPTSITSGQSTTLTWSSTNSTSCTASNGWTGTKAISGTQSVSPTANTTYTLACTGSGGTVSANTSVTVTTTPSPVGSANWQTRSTEPGVVVAYDFSAPPANGGDWKWGSLKADPHITVYSQNQSTYPYARNIDTNVFPPGSSASLRWDVQDYPSGQTLIFTTNVAGATSGVLAEKFTHIPQSLANPFWVRFNDGSERSATFTTVGDVTTVTWSGALPTGSVITSLQLRGPTLTFTGPVNGASSGTLIAPYSPPESSPITLQFSDGSLRKGNISGTLVTWSPPLPTSPTITTVRHVLGGAGERGDLWWISLDDYVDQFGDNGEFWVQWRTRMNSTMATFNFVDRGDEVTSTTYKQLMIGEGMQSGELGMSSTWPYGYRGTGTSKSSNQINGMRVDFEGETNFIAQPGKDANTTPTTVFKYPSAYHGKPGYTSVVTKGTDSSYYTHHNSGIETNHPAACQYQINGLGIPDKSSCFIYPTDEWFTTMVHVKLGARGHGFSSMGLGVQNAPATRQTTNQVLLTTSTWVEHFNPVASAGMYIRVRGATTGNVDALVTKKDTTTFPGQTLLTLSDVTGPIQNEALLVDEYENGFVNSTIEYYGAYTGGAMQLLHRRTGVVMRVGNYAYDSVGYSPTAKYGTFAWTTFMTGKSKIQMHPDAKIWISQIIIKSGSVPPATPSDSGSTNPTPPTVTITATPTSIAYGGTATLSWSSTNVSSCSTSNGLSGTQGSFITPSLTNTTTYSVTCTGSGGSVTKNTTVTVAPAPTDTTPPTVTITAPDQNVTLSGTAVLIAANATDNVGIQSVQFKLGTTNLGPEDTTLPYTITWDTTAIADGAYTVTATAKDAAGNTTTATPVAITVTNTIPRDTTPPTISLMEPTSGAVLAGTAVAISAAASDNVNVASVIITLDGITLTTDTSAPYGTLFNTTQTPNGIHTLTATARDLEGNTATTPAVTVTVNNVSLPPVDTTPPSVPLTLTATTRSSSQIDLAWALSADDTGVTGYLIERCMGSGCTTFTQVGTVTANAYRDTSLKAQTTYRYRVRATDATGNRGSYSPIAQATTLQKGRKPRSSGGVVAGSAWLTPDTSTTLIMSAPNTTTKKTSTIRTTLTTTMSIGGTGTEVTALQSALVTQGLLTPDSVTGYYGPQTETAVKQYQCMKGIVCSGTPNTTGYGMVGLKTRAVLNGGTVPTGIILPVTPKSTTAPTTVISQTSTAVTTTLTLGMTNAQVLTLEKFLIREHYLTNVTADTYFDATTDAALRRFQCASRLVCEGTPDTTGYGATGPRTRGLIR